MLLSEDIRRFAAWSTIVIVAALAGVLLPFLFRPSILMALWSPLWILLIVPLGVGLLMHRRWPAADTSRSHPDIDYVLPLVPPVAVVLLSLWQGGTVDEVGWNVLRWQVVAVNVFVLMQVVIPVVVLRRAKQHFWPKFALCALSLLVMPGAQFVSAMALMDVWL